MTRWHYDKIALYDTINWFKEMLMTMQWWTSSKQCFSFFFFLAPDGLTDKRQFYKDVVTFMLGNDSREILNTFKGNSEYLLALSALSLRIEKIKGFVDFRNTNTTTKDGVPRTTTITYTKQQRAMAYSHHIQAKPARFLDASLHFYMRVCPFVRRSVRHSVRPSVCPLDGQSVRILFFFQMPRIEIFIF